MNKFCSLLVGAPRAQSSLEVQRRINETGAIYKCNLDKEIGNCAPFVFDPWGKLNNKQNFHFIFITTINGNIPKILSYRNLGNVHGNQDQYTYTNEKKDYQWLGATMDGSASDIDKFVVSFKVKFLKQKIKKSTHCRFRNETKFLILGMRSTPCFRCHRSLFNAWNLLLDDQYIVRKANGCAKNCSASFQRETTACNWFR